MFNNYTEVPATCSQCGRNYTFVLVNGEYPQGYALCERCRKKKPYSQSRPPGAVVRFFNFIFGREVLLLQCDKCGARTTPLVRGASLRCRMCSKGTYKPCEWK